MKKLYFVSCCLAVLLLSSAAFADRLRIVATTSDLADIASHIAGDKGDVRFICNGNEDPHFLNARPSYIVMARDADIWIRVGMELEIGWEPPVLDGSRNARIRVGQPGHLDVSANVIKMDVPQGPITRDMGDVHPSGNPHYWLDPWNVRVVAESIAERLSTLRPADANLFKVNLGKFRQQLDERMFGRELVGAVGGDKLWKAEADGVLDSAVKESGQSLGGWMGAMLPFRGKSIVTYHKNWEYFARRFGITVAADLEPKPGIPPTAAHLSAVSAQIKGEGIEVILQEPFYSRRASDRVAGQTGARVVVAASSVGGTREADDIFSVFDGIVSAFKGGTR